MNLLKVAQTFAIESQALDYLARDHDKGCRVDNTRQKQEALPTIMQPHLCDMLRLNFPARSRYHSRVDAGGFLSKLLAIPQRVRKEVTC